MAEPLKYLYGKYYQKSLNFLYPLLGFPRHGEFIPAGTYLWWNGDESIDDYQLIVTYEDHDPALFIPFEKNSIFKNPYLQSCYTVEGGKAYIFDVSPFKDTIDRFMRGRYSKFPEQVKKKILTYYESPHNRTALPGRFMHMSLYPELYYEHVGKELDKSPEELEEVGELANVFDRKLETLEIKIIEKCEISGRKRISSRK